MKKIFQTVVDPKNGDCMQAAIASLFDKELGEVPKFIEYTEGWFSPLWEFLKDSDYEYTKTIYNKKMSMLNCPISECFKDDVWNENNLITNENISKYGGVDGLFFASVLSPKYFNLNTGYHARHAVIIDKSFKIVHDPNPEYKSILRYPLADLIDYNGIVDIILIEKKNDNRDSKY